MHYIICDDNQVFADGLKRQLLELEPMCSVGLYYSAEQLRFDLSEIALDTDAIFMDIKLENSSGIDEIVPILNSFPHIKVVFITGYPDEYSQEIFKCPPDMTPTAFLVKPIKEELLKNALRRIKESLSVQKHHFCIKTRHNRLLIPTDTIMYFSVQGRKVTVFTQSEHIEINCTLAECMKHLPKNFVQCHKSYCVNIKYIQEIHGWNEITLTDGTKIPISRGYAENFKKSVTTMYSELTV